MLPQRRVWGRPLPHAQDELWSQPDTCSDARPHLETVSCLRVMTADGQLQTPPEAPELGKLFI